MENPTLTPKTVIALFETEEDAVRAADDLAGNGFMREQIGVIAGYDLSHPDDYIKSTEDTETKVMGGIGKGLAYGGGLGAVAGGLSALLIPGVGPFVVGGALATTFLGAGLGASVGGVMGGFMKAGVNESQARLFEDALRHGGVVVTVHTNSEECGKAVRILDRNGALDMDEHGTKFGDHGVDRVKGATNSRADNTRRGHSWER